MEGTREVLWPVGRLDGPGSGLNGLVIVTFEGLMIKQMPLRASAAHWLPIQA